MQSSEGGRKLNQAVNTTSKAIIQAKGAFSNWWSSVTAPTTSQSEHVERQGPGEEGATEEIGVPAEEFLDSEVEVAKKEVPSPVESHKSGEVFTA